MIQDLVELLDRNWAALDAEDGVDFVLHCFPFHANLARDTRTAAVLDDLRRDEMESIAALRRAEAEARAGLTAFTDALELVIGTDADAVEEDADDCIPSIARVRILLKPVPSDVGEPEAPPVRPDDRLRQAVADLNDFTTAESARELRARLREIEGSYMHAVRERLTFDRTSGPSALARIEQDFGDLHPPATGLARVAQLRRLARMHRRPMKVVFDKLFGGGRVTAGVAITVPDGELEIDSAEEVHLAAYVERLRRDVRRVYEEVRRRLGQERSLLAVFDRYRQRSMWYDAERLRDLAVHGRGKPEDRLLDTLTLYLFEHGLNPLTRPLAGQLQPDVLGVDARFSFYVEAKQYNAACRPYLLDGVDQVWDMLDQLRGTRFDIAEAFYVVYRRGGPRYALPPRVQHGDRVIFPMLIDIAPSEERGQRAARTYEIELAEFLPRSPTRRDDEAGEP